jgi:hypothetical protein
MLRGEEIYMQGFVKKLEAKGYLENQRVSGMIILKWILIEQTGWAWD